MFRFITRFFSTDAEAKALVNSVAHVAVEYEKASQAILDAEAKFHRVRENKISTFSKLKQRTFDKTFDACSRLLCKIDTEEVRVDDAHAVAKSKIATKRESVDRLNRSIASLDFPPL